MANDDKTIRRVDDTCMARDINQQDRTIRFLAQSARLASDNMVITAGAGKKTSKDFLRNPIVVPYHWLDLADGRPCVIGNVIQDEFLPDGRYQTVRFGTTDLAEEWWHLYGVDRIMRMVSIGWYRAGQTMEMDPPRMLKILAKEGIELKPEEINRLQGVITEYRQRDLSLVAIGADPDAMQHSADEGNGVARAYMRGYERTGGVWIPEAEPVRAVVPGDVAPAAPAAPTTPSEPPADPVAALRADMEKLTAAIGAGVAAFNDAKATLERTQNSSDAGTQGEGGTAGNNADAVTEPEPVAPPRSGYEELLTFRGIGTAKPPAPGYAGLVQTAATVAANLKKE